MSLPSETDGHAARAPTDLPAAAWGGLVTISGAMTALALAIGARYGYHRDELYFLAAGRRLAWGYVDQPPFTPFVARVASEIFGGSLAGLRIFPALAAGITVVLVGLTARELGGNRYAQLLAAGAAALIPVFHTPAIMLSTTGFDQLCWAACFLLVARMLRTGDDRLWLGIGAIAGVGLLNKHAVVFLGFGLLVGFLASRQRSLLLRPTALAGGAIALALWLPNLWWQARHGWPVFEMSQSLNDENGGAANALLFVPGQLVLTGIFTVVIWLPGLWWLLRSPAGRPYEPLGITAVTLTVTLPLVGGKPYYLGAIYVVLLAAGAVLLSQQERRWRRGAVIAAVAAGVVTLPASMPVLPPRYLGPILSVNGEFGEMYGWPELTDQVTSVYAALPDDERDTTVILTANYGEHGAVERFGGTRGAPEAYSGHNNVWWWGPPSADTTTVVAVGIPPARLGQWFESVEQVAVVGNPAGLANEEAGKPIVVARGPRLAWAELWPLLRDYN